MKDVLCGMCGGLSVLTDGGCIYPDRPDLAHKAFWRCACGAYVGCHPGTETPLGTPADAPLRRARGLLHERLDALWRGRVTGKGKARVRAYALLADRMGLERDECHIGNFTLEQCRAAWTALTGVTVADVDAMKVVRAPHVDNRPKKSK